jgi:divalent metal cation (Fe/Co/Zn/Cd) transporter
MAAPQGRTRRRDRRRIRRRKRTLYIVAATFFLLAAIVAYDAIGSQLNREEPPTSPIGIVLSILSLAIPPALA